MATVPFPPNPAPDAPAARLEPLHAALVRRSVGALRASAQRCSRCRRTPLEGEQVHVYVAREGREHVLCELCRALRREPPARSEPVRRPEGARSVQVRRHRAT